MGLSRTVSETNGNFDRKSQNCPVFCTPAERVPLELGIGARSQETRMVRLPYGLKSLIGLPLRHNIPACDGQTDRRTPHDGIDRAMQSVARVKIKNPISNPDPNAAVTESAQARPSNF